ncbi:hypothetical protein PILCRDRAFT_818619 [Piloderma croceum F 1598]|uniref:Uncharacterized protein n=1 Tax=Piloderma croceum (strain F 1598) TaxID=765440 RepID=A0A0C3FXL1_PILCF|nr:hypothetical protein PILCRDRAFT_818619 [Piloderma croceum F 1598]
MGGRWVLNSPSQDSYSHPCDCAKSAPKRKVFCALVERAVSTQPQLQRTASKHCSGVLL